MRPEDILKNAINKTPQLYEDCAILRLHKQKDDWDKQFFVGAEHIVSLVQQGNYTEKGQSFEDYIMKRSGEKLRSLIFHTIVLAPWRYTKGIYEFDQTVYDQLISTNIDNDIPFDVFDRLPQWSMYVRLPQQISIDIGEKQFCGIPIEQYKMDGFFVSVNGNKTEKSIFFIVNVGVDTFSFEYEYTYKTIRSMIDSVNSNEGIIPIPEVTKKMQNYFMEKLLPILFSLTMYLCSQEPDIDLNGEPRLTNGSPIKTKKGVRLIPASKYTTYKVGSSVGKLIREAISLGTGLAKSPHIRKAHWHSYWIGKQEEKVKTLKWLYPMVITGNKVLEL